jgi:hypothetical protein
VVITKRTALATSSSIFDPLGVLGGIIISYKISIQYLWLRKLEWDEQLPLDLQKKMDEFVSATTLPKFHSCSQAPEGEEKDNKHTSSLIL